ncbi:MAG: halocyanin domain-containing protein [Halovenus sp.]
MQQQSRRLFLVTGIAGGVAALAGCGEAARGEDGESPNPMTDDDGEDEEESGGGDDGPEGQLDSYLADVGANGYEGEVVDNTGQDSVTVIVGAGDDGLAFDPPAMQIDSGTTIVWEWSGEGGAHNVIPAEDSEITEFGQEETTDEEGYTVEDTLEEEGLGLYLCDPHRSAGMHGGFIVGGGGDAGGEANGNESEDGQASENQTEGNETN